eukprot:1137740-Pelagomonas_calceolata.AAC.3
MQCTLPQRGPNLFPPHFRVPPELQGNAPSICCAQAGSFKFWASQKACKTSLLYKLPAAQKKANGSRVVAHKLSSGCPCIPALPGTHNWLASPQNALLIHHAITHKTVSLSWKFVC